MNKKGIIAEFCKLSKMPEEEYNEACDIFVTNAMRHASTMLLPSADSDSIFITYLCAGLANQRYQNQFGDAQAISAANELVAAYITVCVSMNLIKREVS